ncbi:hypothetical protein [Hydrocoleum sp. CS-953]|nr:hypothetical protein [Hydrocoleum sp. CS-953]
MLNQQISKDFLFVERATLASLRLFASFPHIDSRKFARDFSRVFALERGK